MNKIDLHKKIVKSNSIIHISAKTGKNVDILLKKIKQTMSIEAISTDTPHLTSMRQYTALKQSSEARALTWVNEGALQAWSWLLLNLERL